MAQDRLAKDMAEGKWPHTRASRPPARASGPARAARAGRAGGGMDDGECVEDPFDAWASEVRGQEGFGERPFERLRRAARMDERERQKWRDKGCPAMAVVDAYGTQVSAAEGARGGESCQAVVTQTVVTDWARDPRIDVGFSPVTGEGGEKARVDGGRRGRGKGTERGAGRGAGRGRRGER